MNPFKTYQLNFSRKKDDTSEVSAVLRLFPGKKIPGKISARSQENRNNGQSRLVASLLQAQVPKYRTDLNTEQVWFRI